MNAKDFIKAIEILTNYHSNVISINKVDENGFVKATAAQPTLHVKECCAAAVKALINAGYSLSMHNNLLFVDKY